MRIHPPSVLLAGLAVALGLGLTGATATSTVRSSDHLPGTTIDLPDGFSPEGIATSGRYGWFGSLADGDIYRVNLKTGKGSVISQGPGTPSVGMEIDRRGRLFVAGGPAGDARVIDGRSGELLKSLQLVDGTSFINDVILSRGAAWFTDSFNAHLIKVSWDRHGKHRSMGKVETLPLMDQWEQGAPGTFNANGITTTPDKRALLVMNSSNGGLYRVDRHSGDARAVDLDDVVLTNGDGLLREGRTLYVVQNQLNQVAVVGLARDGRSGRLMYTFQAPSFDVPTTIARSGDSLYLPNARFGNTDPAPAPYWVTRVPIAQEHGHHRHGGHGGHGGHHR